MQIKIIKANINKKYKVAAYCRVSTNYMGQEESIESQISYYKNMITNNDKYELVNIYSDLGISGTSINKRNEFNKMIDDALNNKIDIIYTKSISRFGRNVIECLDIIHKLKNNLVEVIFEKEGLSSFDNSSEMIFNFMSIMAQEESKSISDNIIWSLDRLASKGIRRLGKRGVFGYDEIDGILTPNKDASIIKMIYEDYGKGMKIKDILSKLDRLGVSRVRSHKKMTSDDIRNIISNVIYKGDRILQKKPHINYLTKKPDNNREYNQYYITNNHIPIVSNDLWERCNKRRQRNTQRC